MKRTVRGPQRIVLLGVGKYDFAEVDLGEPIHLVGANNVGKTTLIAALQFLYIDSQSQMHFSREMAETRKYYFPDPFSYILFECLTPAGYRVIGTHGKGPIHQYEFERFTYTGRLDLRDYLNGSKSGGLGRLAWDEIKLRLSDRDFRLLESQELRAGLTGLSSREGQASFGLLPLAQRNSYPQFSRVFRNLLRLSHVTQQELKGLLVDVFDRFFGQKELNLDENYRAQFESIRRGWREIACMRELQSVIEQMLVQVEKREHLRRTIPGTWQAMLEAVARQRQVLSTELLELRAKGAAVQERCSQLEVELVGVDAGIKTLAMERGGLETQLKDLEGRRERLRGFSLDLASIQRRNLDGRISRLDVALSAVETLGLDELQRRHTQKEREVQLLSRRLDPNVETVGQVVARHMRAADAAATFSLLNAELSSLPIASDSAHGAVVVPELLCRKLAWFVQRFDDEGFADDAITIRWKWLNRPDLGGEMDLDAIARRLKSGSAELAQLAAQIETAKQQRTCTEEREELRAQASALDRQSGQFQEMESLAVNEPVWRERLRAIEGELVVSEERRKSVLAEQKEAEVSVERLRVSCEGREAERRSLDSAAGRLEPPDPLWQGTVVESVAGTWSDLVERYVRQVEEEKQLQASMRASLVMLDRQTEGRFPSGDEEEAIRRLRDERSALPERERALQQLWRSLLAALRADLTALNRDVEALRSRIDALNRQLSRYEVSDLEQLRLEVQDTKELIHVRTVARHEESPLLTDRKSAEKALERIGDLLRDHPRIGLVSLFDLHFHVTRSGGVTKRYADLEKVESNGTTVTIKVLVNLLLLHGLIAEKEAGHVSIPFYLDEVASLDVRNRKAVIALACELGFAPIFASPEPLDGMDNVYFLSDANGRIRLDTKGARVRVLRGEDGA